MLRGLMEGWHPLILVVIVLVLFGGKRLPEAARGLGRSMRIFKSEVKEMKADDTRSAAAKSPEPLEGRVVDPESLHTTPVAEPRHDV